MDIISQGLWPSGLSRWQEFCTDTLLGVFEARFSYLFWLNFRELFGNFCAVLFCSVNWKQMLLVNVCWCSDSDVVLISLLRDTNHSLSFSLLLKLISFGSFCYNCQPSGGKVVVCSRRCRKIRHNRLCHYSTEPNNNSSKDFAESWVSNCRTCSLGPWMSSIAFETVFLLGLKVESQNGEYLHTSLLYTIELMGLPVEISSSPLIVIYPIPTASTSSRLHTTHFYLPR